MLKLEFEKENFKRYNNGKGYLITMDTKDINRKYFSVFKTDECDDSIYLPQILVENYTKDGSYDFEISNCIYVNQTDINGAIEQLEKYLKGYNIAKESIAEFKKAIEEVVI